MMNFPHSEASSWKTGLDLLLTVLLGILPVFPLIRLGALARCLGWAGEDFVRDLNRVIFCFAIPALLLRLPGRADLEISGAGGIIGVVCGATAAGSLITLAYAHFRHEKASPPGVIVQTAIRGISSMSVSPSFSPQAERMEEQGMVFSLTG